MLHDSGRTGWMSHSIILVSLHCSSQDERTFLQTDCHLSFWGSRVSYWLSDNSASHEHVLLFLSAAAAIVHPQYPFLPTIHTVALCLSTSYFCYLFIRYLRLDKNEITNPILPRGVAAQWISSQRFTLWFYADLNPVAVEGQTCVSLSHILDLFSAPRFQKGLGACSHKLTQRSHWCIWISFSYFMTRCWEEELKCKGLTSFCSCYFYTDVSF